MAFVLACSFTAPAAGVPPEGPRGTPTVAFGPDSGSTLATPQTAAEALDLDVWLASPVTMEGVFIVQVPYVFRGLYINMTRDGRDSLLKTEGLAGRLTFEKAGPGLIRGWYSGPAPSATVNGVMVFTGPVSTASSGWFPLEVVLGEGPNTVQIHFPGGCTMDEFTWTPGAPVPEVPRVVTSLSSQSVTQGRPFSFVASATGTPPLTFLWEFRGADGVYRPTTAGSGLALNIDRVTRAHAGRYRLKVSNAAGAGDPVEVLDLTVRYPLALPAWNAIVDPTENGPMGFAGPVFSPSGTRVAAGKEGALAVVRAADGGLVRQWPATQLLALAFSPDEQSVAAFDTSGRLTWRPVGEGVTQESTPFGEGATVEHAVLDSAHDLLAAAARTWNEVRVSRLSGGAFQGLGVTSPSGTYRFDGLALSADGSLLAARTVATRGEGLTAIQVWDLRTTVRLQSWTVSGQGGQLMFSEDGRLLAGRWAEDAVGIWSVDTGERRATWRHAAFAGGFSGGFRKGSNRLTLLGNHGDEIQTFSVEKGEVLDELGISVEVAFPGFSTLTFSPRGDLMAYFRGIGMHLSAWRDPLGLRLETAPLAAGRPTLWVRAHPGARFAVETSTNLITWTPWAEFDAGNGPTPLVYPKSQEGGRVFFRATRP